MKRNFGNLLDAQWEQKKFLCVGLDPDISKIPAHVGESSLGDRFFAFNKAIVDATKDIVCVYKPNPAFYEAEGTEGWVALQRTIEYIIQTAPNVPVILDAKRGDIGNTNAGYARMAFDFFEADAITVQPYQGGDALAPFFERSEKGILVLVKTSNPGSGEFQDLEVDGQPLYLKVAQAVAHTWNQHKNCGVVVGATYPSELQLVREIIGDMPILMPGTGAQGGDLKAAVQAGKNASSKGMMINASRSIIYASSESDFAEAARKEAQRLDGAIRAAL